MSEQSFYIPPDATGQTLTYYIQGVNGRVECELYRDGVSVAADGGTASATWGTFNASYKLLAGHTYYFLLETGKLTHLHLEYTK